MNQATWMESSNILRLRWCPHGRGRDHGRASLQTCSRPSSVLADNGLVGIRMYMYCCGLPCRMPGGGAAGLLYECGARGVDNQRRPRRLRRGRGSEAPSEQADGSRSTNRRDEGKGAAVCGIWRESRVWRFALIDR